MTTPEYVSPYQFRCAIRARGHFGAYRSFLETLSEAEQDRWQNSLRIFGKDAGTADLMRALKLTDEQADDLFRLAASM